MSTGSAHRNDVALIHRLLHHPSTWAVVGLSGNRDRTAFGVAGFLQETLGHRVLPVHPRAETVLGEPGHVSLSAIPDGTRVHVVDFFVNSARVGALVDEAIENASRLQIEALWLQLGVIDQEAAARAKSAGLEVVMDTCPKIEYPRLRM